MAFQTLKLIYNILMGKESPADPLTISLDELCQIWLPYNNSFKTVPSGEIIKRAAEETPPSQPAEVLVPSGRAAAPDKIAAPVEQTRPAEIKITPFDSVVAARKRMELNKFYDDVIQPSNEIISNPAITAGINKAIDLLDRYGDCPSVATTYGDGGEIQQFREFLKEVTIRDHTFRVTRLAVRFTNETYKEPSGMKTVIIIAALCHDFGKIPEIRNNPLYGADKSAGHSQISLRVIDNIFAGSLNDHMLSMVKLIVDNHHKQTNDQLTLILKRADAEARQAEIVEKNSKLDVPEWDAWFDIRTFLDKIGRHVNVIQTDDMWRAFSLADTVYCYPKFLFEEASKMAIDNNIVVIPLMQNEDTDPGIQKIVESLRKNNLLTNELGKNYNTRRYEIITAHGKKKMNLVPIKLSAFANPDEIALLKETYPQIIKGVKAC